VAAIRKPGQVLIGFAVETDDDEKNGLKKLTEKQLDLIVVNNPKTPGAAFDHETNQVMLIGAGGAPERWPLLSKKEVGERLMERAAEILLAKPSTAKTR
jgi:phosphopantothenoylcysteine decarboxylase/phosphopantothenate--cysteine ligase